MEYRTILIALSAFLNSNQMSSNIIKTTFWTPALSLEMLLVFQSPELANNYWKQDLLSIPPPKTWLYRPQSFLQRQWRNEPCRWRALADPQHHSTHAPFWGGHMVRVSLQVLVEPGRRGHLSQSDCYCKDRKPGAIKAYPWRKPAWEWSQNKEKHCWEMEKNWVQETPSSKVWSKHHLQCFLVLWANGCASPPPPIHFLWVNFNWFCPLNRKSPVSVQMFLVASKRTPD